jgi:hypothetical protein
MACYRFNGRIVEEKRPMHPLGKLAVGVAWTLLAACNTSTPASTSPQVAVEDEDERAEFSEAMTDAAGTINHFREQTLSGRNVSGFAMGMFAMTLLNQLSSQDVDLARHFHADGRSMELYLREVFQSRPAEEIASIEEMQNTTNNYHTLRAAARHTLEALHHLPSSEDSIRTQERDRRQLASRLALLKKLVELVAKDVSAPAPQEM